MEYSSIPRKPHDWQQPVAPAEIEALCARAFGSRTRVVAAHELGGGEFNSIYRVRLADEAGEVMLRAGPRAEVALPWHEHDLLRREHSILPYFALIAPLLPRTLAVDFTRELVERDYLFQTVMPGEQWQAVVGELTEAETEALMRQMACIAITIHAVRGERFGAPWPGRSFATWSEMVRDWLERAIADAEGLGLETGPLRRGLARAEARAEALDTMVRTPRLLHGDLWPFNLLIAREEAEGVADGTADDGSGTHITAVLDYDRALWGDPLMDWTFHLLPRKATPREQAAFWEAYGPLHDDAETRFRVALYEVCHIAHMLAALRRQGRENRLPGAYTTLAARLEAMERA
jgi:aminoglycoside phosphotransferase (APT) family kinase protein